MDGQLLGILIQQKQSQETGNDSLSIHRSKRWKILSPTFDLYAQKDIKNFVTNFKPIFFFFSLQGFYYVNFWFTHVCYYQLIKAIYIRLVDMKCPLVVVILIYTHLMQVCWIVPLWKVSRLITQPLIISIVTETCTSFDCIAIRIDHVSQPNIYSLAFSHI